MKPSRQLAMLRRLNLLLSDPARAVANARVKGFAISVAAGLVGAVAIGLSEAGFALPALGLAFVMGIITGIGAGYLSAGASALVLRKVLDAQAIEAQIRELEHGSTGA